MDQTTHTQNTFTNYRKLIALADHDWETAEAGKVAGLNVDIRSANRMVDQYGRVFHHFCTTSYLGLDHHPDLLKGAMSTLWETGTLRVANSKNRCKLAILGCPSYSAPVASAPCRAARRAPGSCRCWPAVYLPKTGHR